MPSTDYDSDGEGVYLLANLATLKPRKSKKEGSKAFQMISPNLLMGILRAMKASKRVETPTIALLNARYFPSLM